MKLGFIGCGNMGSALMKAALKKVSADEIIISDHHTGLLEEYAKSFGIRTGSSGDVASDAKFVFIGVKPQGLKALFDEIGDTIRSRSDRFIIVSMAAGIAVKQICSFIGKDVPVIRIMPNTPVSVGEGMILYTANSLVSADEIDEFCDSISRSGSLDSIDESKIDAASAISGCGPAFVDLFIEAMADGGVECGLPRQKALLYAAQTLLGSAKLMLDSGKHPAELKDAVCSPAGSTIAGVHALENGAFRSNVINAVVSAYERTKELGK